MSELTKEKIYKKELIARGATGNNNLERIRSLGGGSALEDIKDKNGNPRFVEGSLTVEAITGMTITYNKWSLSGTHLMLVLAIEYDTTASFEAGDLVATVTLPKYIMDKIISGTRVVDTQSPSSYKISDDKVFANFRYNLFKNEDMLQIKYAAASIPTMQECYSRLQFDLLIDNE